MYVYVCVTYNWCDILDYSDCRIYSTKGLN